MPDANARIQLFSQEMLLEAIMLSIIAIAL